MPVESIFSQIQVSYQYYFRSCVYKSIYIECSEQLCEYQIIPGGYYENNKLVRSIYSNKDGDGYVDYQQCWASFKCPSGLYAYWRRVSFETEVSYDRVLFYGLNNYQYRTYSGNLGGSETWYTLFDNEITFEFKADGNNSNFRGFKLFLMCK